MTEEIDNHTIRMLQEMGGMRGEAVMRSEETDRGLDDVSQRFDGNTLLLNLVAGVAHDHEQRLTAVEGRSPN